MPTAPFPIDRLRLTLVLLLLALTVACASGSREVTPAAAEPPDEVAAEPEVEAVERAAPSDDEVAALERRSREAYRAGIRALGDGRPDDARRHFDDALAALYEGGPTASEPEIQEMFAEIADAMQLVEYAERQEEALREAEADRLAEIEAEITPERAAEEADIVAEASEEVTYDFPIEINDQVLAWVDIYSGRMKDSFARGLERSGWYLPMIRRIFTEEGIPADLCYMAHVESSYKPTAYSRAHAKGVFQFISATGRRYGLQRNWWMDQRSDPEMSARAAARYLKDLHDEFDDWYLALAAYNGGENRVRKGIKKTGQSDFWALSRARVLRRETRNYVPAILAATLISKNPDAYGFGDVEPFPPIEYDTIQVDTPTDLRVIAECAGTDVQELKRLNPALYRLQTPPGHDAFPVHIPKGTASLFAEKFAEVPVSERILFAHHRVTRGQTLSTIARRYGTSVSAIQMANNMGRRTLIREGAVLRVPTSSGSLSNVAMADYSGEGTFDYIVRRGDTLSTIARRFGTSVSSIQAANGMGRSTRIVAGKRLAIPGPAGAAPPPAAVAAGTGTVVVRRGDSLSTLARRNGTSVAALQAANGMGRSTRIYAGQALRLPDAGSATARSMHTIRRGDTLTRIARRYGASVNDLCTWNGIRADDTLRPGRRLVVAK